MIRLNYVPSTPFHTAWSELSHAVILIHLTSSLRRCDPILGTDRRRRARIKSDHGARENSSQDKIDARSRKPETCRTIRRLLCISHTTTRLHPPSFVCRKSKKMPNRFPHLAISHLVRTQTRQRAGHSGVSVYGRKESKDFPGLPSGNGQGRICML